MLKHIHSVCGGSTTAGLSNVENAANLLKKLKK